MLAGELNLCGIKSCKMQDARCMRLRSAKLLPLSWVRSQVTSSRIMTMDDNCSNLTDHATLEISKW